MQNRTAVVLFNLGGPDSLDAVEPFLFNLFADPDIFKLPLGRFTQKPFARLISRRRAPAARHNYAAIGGKSPLLDNTWAQARALETGLRRHGDYDVFVCMRYWHPLSDAVVQDLKTRGYRNLVLLPLYPQYSRTTTGSSVNEFKRACARAGYQPELRLVRDWPTHPDYLTAIVEAIDGAGGNAGAGVGGEVVFELDADGNPVLDENGEPVEASAGRRPGAQPVCRGERRATGEQGRDGARDDHRHAWQLDPCAGRL